MFDVGGRLFFGAAHKDLKIVSAVDPRARNVVLDLSGVPPVMDTTGMVNIRSLAQTLKQREIKRCLFRAPESINSPFLGREGAVGQLTER